MTKFSGIMDKCNYEYSSGNYSSFESNILDLYAAFNLSSEKIAEMSDLYFVFSKDADYYPDTVGNLDKINFLADMNKQNNLELQVSKTR